MQDKDVSKYNQSLAQALDSIRARSAYVEVCGSSFREHAELTDSTALNGGSDGVAVEEREIGADLTSAAYVFDVVVSRRLDCKLFPENASI